jgi:hypothetical protein
MLSVIVLCRMDQQAARADAVVRTLSALVAASVRGLVRDVVLAGPRDANLGFIADHAGCTCVEAGSEADYLRRALDFARAQDLFVLRSGYIPETGFLDEVEDLFAEGSFAEGSSRGRRSLCAAPETYWQRLIPALSPVVGLIAPISFYREAAGKGGALGFDQSVRAARGRRTLRSRACRVG